MIGRRFGETFPYGTLLVNISGCLVIGFFATFTGGGGGGALFTASALIVFSIVSTWASQAATIASGVVKAPSITSAALARVGLLETRALPLSTQSA